MRIPTDFESLLAIIHTSLPHLGTILTTPPDCKSETMCVKKIGQQEEWYSFEVECLSGELPTCANELHVLVDNARKTFLATPTLICEDGERIKLGTKKKQISYFASSAGLIWHFENLRLMNVIVKGVIGDTGPFTTLTIYYRSKRTRLP